MSTKPYSWSLLFEAYCRVPLSRFSHHANSSNIELQLRSIPNFMLIDLSFSDFDKFITIIPLVSSHSHLTLGKEQLLEHFNLINLSLPTLFQASNFSLSTSWSLNLSLTPSNITSFPESWPSLTNSEVLVQHYQSYFVEVCPSWNPH